MIEIGPEEITDAFQDVMRHLETPVIRSAGVPLYLLYPANGGEPKVLPQLLTEGLVKQALEDAAKA